MSAWVYARTNSPTKPLSSSKRRGWRGLCDEGGNRERHLSGPGTRGGLIVKHIGLIDCGPVVAGCERLVQRCGELGGCLGALRAGNNDEPLIATHAVREIAIHA